MEGRFPQRIHIIGNMWISTVGDFRMPLRMDGDYRLPVGVGFRDGRLVPMWYETMVFAGEGAGQPLLQQRYLTAKEARAGHAEVVRLIQRTRRYRHDREDR